VNICRQNWVSDTFLAYFFFFHWEVGSKQAVLVSDRRNASDVPVPGVLAREKFRPSLNPKLLVKNEW
jgi:hypothetical protein